MKKSLMLFSVFLLALMIAGSASAVDNNQNNMNIQNNSTSTLPDPVNTRTGEHFTTIQAAIDSNNTINGDTILVEEGTYNESVTVNKTLNLIAQGKAIVIPDQSADPGFTVTANSSIIQGFTIQNHIGIIIKADNCKISNNTIIPDNEELDGIQVSSNYCTISDNKISNCRDGIIIQGDNCIVSDNTITNCQGDPEDQDDGCGINVQTSNNCTISGNNISDCLLNGIHISKSTKCIIKNNILSGNGYGQIKTELKENDSALENSTVPGFNDSEGANGIFISDSSENTLEGNQIQNNNYGIGINNSPNNILTGNILLNNTYNLGISDDNNASGYLQNIDTSNTVNGKQVYYLIGAYNLTIDGNSSPYSSGIGYLGLVSCNNITIKNISISNNYQGILLAGSHNCLITGNQFTDNTVGIDMNYTTGNTVKGNIKIINNQCGVNIEGSLKSYISDTISNNGWGINISNSSQIKIENCQIKENQYGIFAKNSQDNYMPENNVSQNTVAGIVLVDSTSELMGNTLQDNPYNLNIYSEIGDFKAFMQNIDVSNTINGKPIYYLVGENNLVIDGNDQEYSSGVGYLGLVSCNNITVKNITFTNNYSGILLAGSYNCNITNNQINNNLDGINLFNSSINQINGNSISNNQNGIYLTRSTQNVIIENKIDQADIGICLSYNTSSNNIVEKNEIKNCSANGIYSIWSSGNTFNNNEIENSGLGIYLRESDNNMVSKNILSGSNIGIRLYSRTEGIADNKITENQIDNAEIGILMGFGENNLISKNSISNCTQAGIYLNGLNSDSIISNNHISKSKYGINLISDNDNTNISANTVINNTEIGIYVTESDTKYTVRFNRITENPYGLVNEGSESVDAILNWWGSNNPDFSKLIKGDATTDPWMVLSITADPITVNVGETSSITAELLNDNQGNYHDPTNGVIPYTGPANFTTSQGTINDANFSNGKAQSTLTGLSTPGTAKVSSTVDDQTVTVDITVNNGITINQLVITAGTVKNYYETHHTLPADIIISGQTITMPQFLQLLVKGTINLSKGITTPIPVQQVNPAPNPSGTYTTGSIYKTEYLNIAQNIKNFINTNGRAPNYQQTTLGKIPFSKLVYMYSKIINFYGAGKRLPNYVTI